MSRPSPPKFKAGMVITRNKPKAQFLRKLVIGYRKPYYCLVDWGGIIHLNYMYVDQTYDEEIL